MKLRSLLFVAAGIAIGYKVATTMHQDDPDIVRGPQREQASGWSRAPAGVRRSAAHRRSGGRPEPRCDPACARRDPFSAVRVRRVRQRRQLELTTRATTLGQRVPNVTDAAFPAVQSLGAASRSTA